MIKKDDVFELTREEIAYIIANSNSYLTSALDELLDSRDPFKKKSSMIVKEWQGYKLHICYDNSTWLILLNDLVQILKVSTEELKPKIGNKFKRLKYLKDEDGLPEDIYTFVTAKGMYQAILAGNSIPQAAEFQDYVLSLIHYQWLSPNWNDGLTFLDWFYHLGKEDKKKRRKQNEN